ncbi:Organic hydroperoxide resistance protein OhrA [Sporosarcina sp. P37]|uniref:organic hydroperoxide resistance protein n=1 Tax=unclassified Sporosarcina TaxID=2647733 RepID=UPI0009BF3F37|nr:MULTISPECIES: organic hydroperoxide resistance protein [unclassified Sporosarcina]ARD48346.1 Organic hydroperoxide resistance protein OhrA [Sporosarcina sp. P33]ARK24851.1 Organic hydroperoxide resistance protein OhrA [Sporosarcina sp. P37]PID20009.1 Organic hydroperoxide resistance protein OhrA [Sporosarcina sp. P35]
MSEKLFTSTATANGGREGHVVSSDQVIDLDTAMPGTKRAKELANSTNPEQLFAAGYAACFDGALQLVAGKERIKFTSEVTANVSLCKDESDGGFKIEVELQVKGTDIEKAQLEELVEKAHQVCPYSKATRGNVDVTLTVL